MKWKTIYTFLIYKQIEECLHGLEELDMRTAYNIIRLLYLICCTQYYNSSSFKGTNEQFQYKLSTLFSLVVVLFGFTLYSSQKFYQGIFTQTRVPKTRSC